jgi:hypothetical protein
MPASYQQRAARPRSAVSRLQTRSHTPSRARPSRPLSAHPLHPHRKLITVAAPADQGSASPEPEPGTGAHSPSMYTVCESEPEQPLEADEYEADWIVASSPSPAVDSADAPTFGTGMQLASCSEQSAHQADALTMSFVSNSMGSTFQSPLSPISDLSNTS